MYQKLSLLASALVLVGAGCAVAQNKVTQKAPPAPTSPVVTTEPSPTPPAAPPAQNTGVIPPPLTKTVAQLTNFNKTAFDAAVASGKVTLLYFYSAACAVCREEINTALTPAFNELNTTIVVGFRVNFNDSQTDVDEKALAEKYKVTADNTKVILNVGSIVQKSSVPWNKQKYINELRSAYK